MKSAKQFHATKSDFQLGHFWNFSFLCLIKTTENVFLKIKMCTDLRLPKTNNWSFFKGRRGGEENLINHIWLAENENKQETEDEDEAEADEVEE